ncbi:MAG: hypothetical protein ACK4NF_06230, partial [Planctomycetota bacterium]
NGNGLLDTSNLELEKSFSASYEGVIESSENYNVLYKVKIVDTSSKINVNDEGIGVYNTLSTLSYVIGEETNLAEVIKQLKGEGEINLQSLRLTFGKKYDYLKQFITIYGKKRNIIEVEDIYKEGNIKRIKDLALPRYKSFKKTPVNINTASAQVLLAILKGIEGFYLVETTTKNKGILVVGTSNIQEELSLGKMKIIRSSENVESFVKEIMLQTGSRGFYNEIEFANFLFVEGEKYLSDENLQLIYANTTANSNIIRTNSDLRLLSFGEKKIWLTIDKTFITNPTVEFSYYPSGIFEIEILVTLISKKKTLAKGTKYVVYDFLEEENKRTCKDFLEGISEKLKADLTRNNQTLEIFPGNPEHLSCQITLSPLVLKNFLPSSDELLFYTNFLNNSIITYPPEEDKLSVVKKYTFLPDGLLKDTDDLLEYKIKNIIPYEIIDIAGIIAEEAKKIDSKYKEYFALIYNPNSQLLKEKIIATHFSVFLLLKPFTNPLFGRLQVLFNMTNPRKKSGRAQFPFFLMLFSNPIQTEQLSICKNNYFLYWGYAFPASRNFYCAKKGLIPQHRWDFVTFSINNVPINDYKESIKKKVNLFAQEFSKLMEEKDKLKRRVQLARLLNQTFGETNEIELNQTSKIFINGSEVTIPLGFPLDFSKNKESVEELKDRVYSFPENFFTEKDYTFSIGGSYEDLFWNYPFPATFSEVAIIKPKEDISKYVENIYRNGRFYNKETSYTFKQSFTNRTPIKIFIVSYLYEPSQVELELQMNNNFFTIPKNGVLNINSQENTVEKLRIIFKPKGAVYASPHISEITLIFAKKPEILYQE